MPKAKGLSRGAIIGIDNCHCAYSFGSGYVIATTSSSYSNYASHNSHNNSNSHSNDSDNHKPPTYNPDYNDTATAENFSQSHNICN